MIDRSNEGLPEQADGVAQGHGTVGTGCHEESTARFREAERNFRLLPGCHKRTGCRGAAGTGILAVQSMYGWNIYQRRQSGESRIGEQDAHGRDIQRGTPIPDKGFGPAEAESLRDNRVGDAGHEDNRQGGFLPWKQNVPDLGHGRHGNASREEKFLPPFQ